MGAVKPTGTVPGYELNSAVQARSTLSTHDDFVEEGPRRYLLLHPERYFTLNAKETP